MDRHWVLLHLLNILNVDSLWHTLYTRTRLSRCECGPADPAYLLSMHVNEVAKTNANF